MTAKEKAKELVDKFLDIQDYENLNLDLFCDECGMSLEAAKYCALIAVDEILEAITFNMYDEECYNIENNYWEQVKQEIKRL